MTRPSDVTLAPSSSRTTRLRKVRSPRLHRSSRAFTILEVLISLTLFAVGAAGIITMLRATVQGNYDSRRMDTANAIARKWMERLHTDGMSWTLPGPANPAGNNRAAALLLSNVGNWHLPTERLGDAVSLSPGANILGQDVPQAQAMFCTHVRLTLLNPQLIRAEVRVFWPRDIFGLGDRTPAANYCSANQIAAFATGPDLSRYHFFYAVSSIRENAAQ